MSDTELAGGCLCGAKLYEITGPFDDVSHCHCSMCRKAAGAAFMTFVCVETKKLRWITSPPTVYKSSDFAERSFCPHCGTSLTYWSSKFPGHIDVSAATLDDPNAVTPNRHIYVADALSWGELNDSLPRHPAETPRP